MRKPFNCLVEGLDPTESGKGEKLATPFILL
jgi:hypothetical protein